jgi:Haem-binding domain
VSKRSIATRIVLALVGLLLVIQLVPYGRDHGNPPVTRAAQWTDPAAEQLATESCYDCHSNLTKWLWTSNIAPASWLVQNDVDGGRRTLNFSEWDRGQPELGDISEQISSGEMPPLQYTLVHSGSSLSDAEKATLVKGLEDLYRSDPPPLGGGG